MNEHSFSTSYSGLDVIQGHNDMVRVAAPGGTIFSTPLADGEDFYGFREKILAHVHNHGLVAAAEEFKGLFSPRAASIVEHYFADMAGFESPTEKALSSGVWEDHAKERTDSDKPMPKGGVTDAKKDGQGPYGDSVTTDADTDHVKPGGAAKNLTERGDSDMGKAGRDGKPKSAIDKEIVDRRTAQVNEGGESWIDEGGESWIDENGEGEESDNPFADDSTKVPEGSDSDTVKLTVEVDLGEGTKTIEVEGAEEYDEEIGDTVFAVTKATCEGQDCLDEIEGSEDAALAIQEALEAQKGGGEDPMGDPGAGDDFGSFDDIIGETPDMCEDCGKMACECGGMEKTASCTKCANVECIGCDTTEAMEKHAARLEALYETKLRRVKAELQKRHKKAMRRLEANWMSALDLAARRQQLNLSQSPLKIAFGDVLCNSMRINASEDYPGMDGELAVQLIETASSKGFRPFIASLVRDARRFMQMPPEAVRALRKDAQLLDPVGPRTAQVYVRDQGQGPAHGLHTDGKRHKAQLEDEYGGDPDALYDPSTFDNAEDIEDEVFPELGFDDYPDFPDHEGFDMTEPPAPKGEEPLGEEHDPSELDTLEDDADPYSILTQGGEEMGDDMDDMSYDVGSTGEGRFSVNQGRSTPPGSPIREYNPAARTAAENMKRQAMEGNFQFAPAPAVEASVPANSKGFNIRQALKFTKVASISGLRGRN